MSFTQKMFNDLKIFVTGKEYNPDTEYDIDLNQIPNLRFTEAVPVDRINLGLEPSRVRPEPEQKEAK